MYARNVIYINDQKQLVDDPARIAEMKKNIKEGDVYVARNVVSKKKIQQWKEYLVGIGKGSLPNYKPIMEGCPNFHRINRWDERSYVMGCFHQFVFFPWNQDVFDLFEEAKEVYHIKNLISGLPKEKFLGRTPQDGCVTRLAFQFYPAGTGGLNKHQDPVDHHQLSVPILIMSKKGVDFQEGGSYVEKEGGVKVYCDEIADPGDVVWFNASAFHGVEKIDPKKELDWTSFDGRWMLLYAINKLAGNSAISDAVDLEKAASKK